MNTIESLEQRQLLSVVADQAHTATLQDDDGSIITIRIDGHGTATADNVRGGFSLSLTNTDNKTALWLDVTGGNKSAIARSVSVRGSIGAIHARAVELAGPLSTKSIESLDVRGLTNASINSGWIGAITAGRIGGSVIAADRIGTLIVAGDMTSSRIHVSPGHDDQIAIRSAIIAGTISNSTIFALGDIGSVSAGAMLRSNVTAGVIFSGDSTADHLIQPLPNRHSGEDLYDFSGKYNIGRVSVSGTRPVAFSETNIGAYEISNVSLANVDGTSKAASEFGVAAFAIGRVNRTFDTANASLNAQQNTSTRFTVRQLQKPLTFNPTTGTYTGSSSSGVITLTNSGRFNGDVIAVNISTVVPLPSTGLQIGTVENHRARTLFVAKDGRYELRNRNGNAIARSSNLGLLIDGLFADAHMPIKVERPSTLGDATFRTTSVGPALHLTQDFLGQIVATPVSVTDGRLIYTPPGQVAPPAAVSVRFRLPTFNDLSIDLKRRGNKLLVYGANLLLVKDATLPIGNLIGVMNTSPLEVTQTLAYSRSGLPNSDLSSLVIAHSADRIGSRRLPARWVQDGNNVTIFGLPNGGTAVINNLGRAVLNASGATAVISTMRSLKSSLIAADIGL
jgi:hypothetical protein